MFKTVGQLVAIYSPDVLLRVLTTAVEDFEAVRGALGRAGADLELDENALARIYTTAFGFVSDQIQAERQKK